MDCYKIVMDGLSTHKIITYSPWMWPFLFLPLLFLLMMISTVDTHTTLIATPTTVAAVVAAAIVVLPFCGVVDNAAVVVQIPMPMYKMLCFKYHF